MRSLATLISLLSLATAVVAAPHRTGAARSHFTRRTISSHWTEVDAANPSAPISFALVLKGDYAGLTQRMQTIAAQQSPWLSKDELATYVSPAPGATAAVEAAIQEMGTITGRSTLGDKITVTTTVANASQVSRQPHFATRLPQYAMARTNGSRLMLYCSSSQPNSRSIVTLIPAPYTKQPHLPYRTPL